MTLRRKDLRRRDGSPRRGRPRAAGDPAELRRQLMRPVPGCRMRSRLRAGAPRRPPGSHAPACGCVDGPDASLRPGAASRLTRCARRGVCAPSREPVLILWHTRSVVVIGASSAPTGRSTRLPAPNEASTFAAFTGGGAVHPTRGPWVHLRASRGFDAAVGVPDLYAPLLTGTPRAARSASSRRSTRHRARRRPEGDGVAATAAGGRRSSTARFWSTPTSMLVAAPAAARRQPDGRPRPAGAARTTSRTSASAWPIRST